MCAPHIFLSKQLPPRFYTTQGHCFKIVIVIRDLSYVRYYNMFYLFALSMSRCQRHREKLSTIIKETETNMVKHRPSRYIVAFLNLF